MSAPFQLVVTDGGAFELVRNGRLLMRYVYRPETPADEAPRPYAHPVCTLAGAELTNFRPNDHRWHHGLSFTINGVDGVNFWGGGTYRQADGYQWRGDHGEQRHLTWLDRSPNRLVEALEWRGRNGEVLLSEQRVLTPVLVSEATWSLRWCGSVVNVSGRPLTLANCHSAGGLAGSHYTGLQFRGARDLLDEHGDPGVGIDAEGGLAGAEAVHGAKACWMEWRGQKDATLQRVHIRFANEGGPLHWFVRRQHPLAALPFHYDRDLVLPPGGRLALDHTLSFTDA